MVTTAAAALEPGRALTQYVHEAWTDRDGLPQSYVQTILQTRDGYLWIGTQEGLVRYDGQRFTVFDERNTPGLRASSVLSLLEDDDGTLWVVLDGALATLRQGEFQAVHVDDLPGAPRVMARDRAGNYWLGMDGVLCRLQLPPRTCYTAKDGLIGEKILALASTGEDELWVGTDYGLVRLSRGRFEAPSPDSGLPASSIHALLAAADGALWVGTDYGLYRYRDGVAEGRMHGIAAEVWSLLLDRAGSLWVGTSNAGLFRVRDGRATQLSTRDGLSHDAVHALFEDREGSLWVGTRGGGLERLSDGKVTPWGPREGLRGEVTFSVREDRTGNVWVGTDSGLNRIAPNGEVTSFGEEQGLTSTFVASLAASHTTDELWVGTHGGGVHRLRGGRAAPYPLAHWPHGGYVWSLLVDRRGVLWIGSGGGLGRMQDGRLTVYLNNNFAPADSIQSLLETKRGELWAGTLTGLYRWHDERLELSPAPGQVPVLALHEDAAGTLWVGTYRYGLHRLRGSSHHRIGSRQGLFDDTAYAILEDDTSHLWMSSNRGIYRVAKRELEELVAGKRQRVQSLVLGIGDGMRSSECNAGGTSGWKGSDGRLWFATMRGAVVVDPRRLGGNRVPPLLKIESVRANQRPVDLAAHRRLPAGVRRLEVRYTALSFRDAERVRFKHRLEGFDADWVDAGAQRVATYTNLAPGQYRFQVIAANGDGVWNREGAAMSFELASPFYRAPWFLALCVLGAIGAGAGGYQLRFHYLVRKNRKLEALVAERTEELQEAVRTTAVLEERNRIAQDLHDSLAQGLAGVVVQLEATRAWAGGAPPPVQERLQEASRTAKDCLEETRRSVQALHPPLLEGADLPQALAKLADQLSAGEVAVEFALVGAASPIPKSVEIQLLRIAQEAIANALKHAAPRHIRVSLRAAADAIELTVDDDGRGIAAPAAGSPIAPGMGLPGMQRRARRLGGELSVDSHPGRGTTVRATVPHPRSETAAEIGA
ncbi:MAG TPA: two-component regulator propeller domain-containing protein [Thermoanaerobaculia bacterium]|nr:two-component regulator propeller domain-containing protein [Thermoanaerobaculia bacterium]